MKIPQYIRQEKPQVVPGVRVSPEAMTQDIGAMGQFGQAMSKVGNEFVQKLREAREVSEYSNAENTWKEGINQFKLGLDTDYKTHSERFEKRQAELYNEISSKMTESNSHAAFKRFVDKNLVDERFNIGRDARKLEIAAMEADYYKQIELAVKRGDVDFINKSTAGAVSAGILKADVGETARQNALRKVEYDSTWQTAIGMPDEESATEFIEKEKGLTPTERNSLLTAASRHFTAEEARQKETVEKQRELDRAKLWEKEKKNELTYQDIDATSLDEKEKRSEADRLDKRNKAIVDGEKDPFKTIDPAVDNQVMQQIYSDDPPTEQEIKSLSGNGLSVERAEHWINILKKPDAGYKRALDYLKSQIMPSKGLLVGESSSEATAYWKAVISIDEEIKAAGETGKPLTGNNILKKAMDIAPLYKMTVQEQIEALKGQLKPGEKAERKVTKTGTYNGRKVIQYDDGKTEYAD
jgi:hypothetical protein